MDFFWSGKHWVQAAALYLAVAEGGQGLINIQARLASFRLRSVQMLLYGFGPRWCDTVRLLMRRGGCLSYDRHLFLLDLEDVDLTGLTPFYSSVLQAWKFFRATRDQAAPPGLFLVPGTLSGRRPVTPW